MIRCKQKGPHQQVRFWLSLSVLPTARGLLALTAMPTALHPELTQRGHDPGITPVLPQSTQSKIVTGLPGVAPQLEALALLPQERSTPSFRVLWKSPDCY